VKTGSRRACPWPPRRASRLPAGASQFVKFCVVGTSGYISNLSVYAVLQHLGVDFRAAAAISFAVSATGNYLLHRAWTFRRERSHFGTQGARFLAVSLAALAVNELWLSLFVALGVDKLGAQAAACILVIPVSFGGNKLWAFRQPSRGRGEAVADRGRMRPEASRA
jgi:putative flippase GtrA